MNSTQYTLISAVKARQNFGEIINRALYGGERFIVERGGKEAIKIEAVNAVQDKQTAKDRFFAVREEVLERVSDVDEATLLQAVDEAIDAVRTKSDV
jgi:hypothetical protein